MILTFNLNKVGKEQFSKLADWIESDQLVDKFDMSNWIAVPGHSTLKPRDLFNEFKDEVPCGTTFCMAGKMIHSLKLELKPRAMFLDNLMEVILEPSDNPFISNDAACYLRNALFFRMNWPTLVDKLTDENIVSWLRDKAETGVIQLHKLY